MSKPSTPRRGIRLKKTTGPLSKSARAILQRMVAGEALVGRRTFPRPFVYLIGLTPLAPESNPAPVTQTIVADLAAYGFIDSPHVSPFHDAIRYTVTDAGRKFLATEPPPPDDSQLDWTAA